ncbi:hypothetical protein A4A49_57766, partial [Nicotiana attenuata]
TALARIYKAVNSALQTNSKLNGCGDQANTLSKSVGVQQQIESNEQADLQQEKAEESGALNIGQVIPKTTGVLDMKAGQVTTDTHKEPGSQVVKHPTDQAWAVVNEHDCAMKKTGKDLQQVDDEARSITGKTSFTGSEKQQKNSNDIG